MSESPRLDRSRLAGIGLIVGGAAFGGLSFVVPDVFLAGLLFAAAIVIKFEQPFGDDTLHLWILLGMFGVLLFAHAVADIGAFDGALIATVLVIVGFFELTLGPRLRSQVGS